MGGLKWEGGDEGRDGGFRAEHCAWEAAAAEGEIEAEIGGWSARDGCGGMGLSDYASVESTALFSTSTR